jgi:hypothetical protein
MVDGVWGAADFDNELENRTIEYFNMKNNIALY